MNLPSDHWYSSNWNGYTCIKPWHNDFYTLSGDRSLFGVPYTIFSFCMPWENIAFLWRTFFCSPEYSDMPWLRRWALITGFIIVTIIKKTVIASFIITRMLLIHVTVSMIMILIWSRKDSYSDRLCETRQLANGQVIVVWSNLEPLLESSHILPEQHSRTRVVLREEWGLKSLHEAVVVHSNAFYFWKDEIKNIHTNNSKQFLSDPGPIIVYPCQ